MDLAVILMATQVVTKWKRSIEEAAKGPQTKATAQAAVPTINSGSRLPDIEPSLSTVSKTMMQVDANSNKVPVKPMQKKATVKAKMSRPRLTGKNDIF